MKYEAGFCLTPNACINQTEDQRIDTMILAEKNLTYDFGLQENLTEKPENFIRQMGEFLGETVRQKQKAAMAQHYDTESTNNVCEEILGLLR